MSWKQNLETASFDNVTFDILSIRDSLSRRFVRYTFPGRDGADLADFGRNAWNSSFTAVFYGDNYETELSNFVNKCDEGKSYIFVHPIWGAITAKVNINSINHDANERDYCTVDCDAIQDGTNTQIPDLLSIDALEDDVETEVSILESLAPGLTSVLNDAKDYYANARDTVKEISKRFNRLSKKIDSAVQTYDDVTDVENYTIVRSLNRLRYSSEKLKNRIIKTKPKMVAKRTNNTVPASVIAQDLYGDGSRYNEVTEQNKVRNPFLIQSDTELTVPQE